MGIVAFLYVIEGMICKVIIQPNGSEDLEALSLIIFFINALVTLYSLGKVVKEKECRELNAFFMLSCIGRIMFMLWDIYAQDIFVLPNAEGDAQAYASIATSFAYGGRRGLVDFGYFPYYMSLFYRVFGVQRINAQFINIYLSMCSLVMVYRILTMLNIRSSAKNKTIELLCILPNYMLISSVFLQESYVTFMIVSAVYFFTKWWTTNKAVYFPIAMVFSVLGSLIHMGGLVPIVGFVAMFFFVRNSERKLDIKPSQVVLTAGAVVLGLALLTTFGGDILGKTGGKLDAESLTSYGALSDSSGSQYTIGIPGLPPTLDLILNSPIRVIYFVFAPLPWQWRGIGDIIAFFGSTIFYIYAVYVAIKTIKNAPKGSIKSGSQWSYFIVIIAILLIATLMFGWGVSSSGSALRHREKFTCVTAILIGLAIHLGEKVETL